MAMLTTLRIGCKVAPVIALVLTLMPEARAGGAADFYSGRTLSVLVGHSVGGGYVSRLRIRAGCETAA